MKVSPLDIYNHEFKKAIGGYNTAEVDEFLDEVGIAYEKLLKEVNKLQDENESLKEKISSEEKMENKLENILLTVQETAKDITKQAKQEANIIIKKAEIKGKKIEEEAREKMKKEYESLESIKEARELFKIRFKTMLESHLEMLEKEQENELQVQNEVAAEEWDIED
ncbi:DivIVA domain-containing protein [Natronospora cellulosivora (SeqCode)]